jgi:hypothetical protein
MTNQNPDIRLQLHCLIRTDLYIGHLAGYVPSDIYSLPEIARDVLFVCGSDKHAAIP